MLLGALLVAALALSLTLGVLTKMRAREIAGMWAAMAATVLVFWGLVALL